MKIRFRVYLLTGLTTSLLMFGVWSTPARAATMLQVPFDSVAVQGGQTLTLDDGSKLGIFPGALTGPATVNWGTASEGIPTPPTQRALLGSAYRLQITGTTITPEYKRPLGVAIPFGDSSWIRQVWQYDLGSNVWTPLSTTYTKDKQFAQAAPTTLDGWVMVLEDRTQHEGIASWYCKKACSPKYPTLHGTSNDFPIGTTVRVRNLENGRSVDVKIVSRWGQPAGRIIDLSGPAFAALGSSNAGLAKVNVSLPQAKVLGASTSSLVSKIETILNRAVTNTGRLEFPKIAARPFYVIDQGSGTVLAEHAADQPVPIASITKLMTASVFLDTKTDLKKPITYSAADQTPYAYLKVKPGETILVRDLFYSLLVGSANNAAPALVRSTGLSQPEFIARMNQKAKDWGMTNTTFVDVHGLSPANVSSAHDVALLTAHAFHEYQPIRFVSVKREYTFTTLNTKVTHTIKSTDKVLGSGMLSSNLAITGGKTGFLNEAKYTYTLRAANKTNGAQVIVVLLGSNTSQERFRDAAAVTNWAFENFRWSV